MTPGPLTIAARREAIRDYLVAHGPTHASEIFQACGLTKAKAYYALHDKAMFFQHRDSRWDVTEPAR